LLDIVEATRQLSVVAPKLVKSTIAALFPFHFTTLFFSGIIFAVSEITMINLTDLFVFHRWQWKRLKMNKILNIILIFGIALMGISVRGQSETETHFAVLLKGEKIISPGQSFDTGKSDFNPDIADFMNQLGEFLKENQGLIVEVSGHTDNTGTREINQKLSLSRAQRIKQYLVRKLKIDEDSIIVKGYSSRFPIADNNTPKGRAKNRRIEISTLKNNNPAGKLTYLRRDVFTKLPDKIDFIRASINQDLFHLYRVLTRAKSNANVVFQDLSKINLGPQSLMIIYSLLEKSLPLPRKQNVNLLTGGLRTKLNKLKGRLQVETPACLVSSHSVEILLGIDKKKKSALSVFDGKSEVKAQGKKVDVPGGFGTTVEMGKPPNPPEPLPKAPQLIKPIESTTNLPAKPDTSNVSIQFQWQRADLEDRYHLQVASDPQFDKILEDLTPGDNTADLSLGIGTYYWRVAAINKRGIEGYSSQSFFTITGSLPDQPELPDRPGLSDLPLNITPGTEDVHKTTQPIFSVYGKTIPGTRIIIKDKQFQANDRGEFSGAIPLHIGWNHIIVQAIHPDYQRKIIWLSFYRRALGTSAAFIGLRFDNAVQSDNFDKTYTFQLGKSFTHGAHFETELSFGLARLNWKDFPGDFEKVAAAFPFTGTLRFMPIKGKVIPFLSTGLTAYLTFVRIRGTDVINAVLFISPEIGGGFSFPVFNSRASFEVKYTPLLKKKPFHLEMAHRIAFILRIM
jgi:hypothetical protein